MDGMMKKGGGKSDARAEEAMEGIRQDRQQAIGGAIPMAREPLQPANVNALGEVAIMAAEKLSGGQAPELQVAEVTAPVEQLPADVGSIVATIAEGLRMVGGPAAKKYHFDVAKLATDNEGLDRMQGLIASAARDKQVVKAMSGGASPRAQAPDTDTDTDTDTEE